MSRPVSDPTLAMCRFRLGAADRAALARIARSLGGAAKRPKNLTDAVRHAIRAADPGQAKAEGVRSGRG